MKQVADLLTVMHDIDRLKGRSCRNCEFWHSARGWKSECDKGMAPLDTNDGCDHFKDKHADRNAKLTALVVGSLCLLLTAVPLPAKAFDNKEWSGDGETREWFKSLHNEYGTNCCDFADGDRVDDVDYRENDDGTYEVFYDGGWHHVELQRVLKGSNRVGYAIIWRSRGTDQPYCFLPGAGG